MGGDDVTDLWVAKVAGFVRTKLNELVDVKIHPCLEIIIVFSVNIVPH